MRQLFSVVYSCFVSSCKNGSTIFLLSVEVSYRLDARKLLNLELLVSEAEGMYYLFFPPVRSQRSNNVLHLPTEVINRASGS